MKPISVEVEIEAPAIRVWERIIDFESYPRWNGFTPRINLDNDRFAVGAEFDLDCRMTKTRLLRGEREVILAIEPERMRFCMGTSRTRGRPGIRSWRWQECVPLEGSRTRFVNAETFRGPLAPLVYARYAGRLRRAFEQYCADLKRYVEAGAGP
jgi:uncharacterized protein YndB with AHSA1/START domain